MQVSVYSLAYRPIVYEQLVGPALLRTGSGFHVDRRLLVDTAAARARIPRGVCGISPMDESSAAGSACCARTNSWV